MYLTFQRLNILANFLSYISQLVLIIMISSMVYEVVARYIFNSPTLWAFDISYMLNGSIFLLAAAYTLKEDAHVRIDFLSTKLPMSVQQIIHGIFYFFILAPIFFFFSKVALNKTINAFINAEVESVSPWAPLVWPFYATIAIGLLAFTLQFIIEGLSYLIRKKPPNQNQENVEEVS